MGKTPQSLIICTLSRHPIPTRKQDVLSGWNGVSGEIEKLNGEPKQTNQRYEELIRRESRTMKTAHRGKMQCGGYIKANALPGILAMLFLVIAWQAPAIAATLTTDKPDYFPGDYVTFTGTGWQPGETVNIDVYETSAEPDLWVGSVSATADADGSISNSDLVVQQSFLGQGFAAYATGTSSGLTVIATFTDAVANPGVAPVNPPCNGFAIDGDLFANAPIAFTNKGDWIFTNAFPGTGCGVLNLDGTAIDPINTFHITDLYNSSSDNNFAGGLKVNDDPNTWTWVSNPVGDKVDINNALFHLTKDSNGHTWLAVSGDRFKDTGDAYIDFEFLQTNLFVFTNAGGTTGGFTSTGPNCGRTTNDFILTISFTKGGKTAGFFVSRWETNSAERNPNGCGTSAPYFDYFDVTATVPANSYYAAVNTNTIYVPYGAFGGLTYDPNTFAEAAVDLTALLGSFNPCLTLGVNSLLVKTKVSQSDTATIVDFINPVQIRPPLVIGPAAFAGPNQTNCADPSATTTFQLNGTAQPGSNPITSLGWEVVSPASGVTIDPSTPASCGAGCTSLPITVHVTGAPVTATLRLTVHDQGACANNFTHDDVVITVNPLPDCTITPTTTTTLAAGSKNKPFSGPSGTGLTYAWSFSTPLTGVTFSPNNDVTARTVHVDVDPSLLTGSFTLQLIVTDANGCQSTCHKTVEIEPSSAGCSLSETPFACVGATSIQYTVTPGGGTVKSYAWDLPAADNTSGATFTTTPTSSPTVNVDAGGLVGHYRVHVLITFTDDSTIDCFTDTTVQQVTLSLQKTDISCNGAADGTITASAVGGTTAYQFKLDSGSYQSSGSFTGVGPGPHTVYVKDAHNCTDSKPVTISQPDTLVLSLQKTDISCNGAADGTIAASAVGGTTAYQFKLDSGSYQSSGSFTGVGPGPHTVYVKDAHNCTDSKPVTISQPDSLACSVSGPSDVMAGSTGNKLKATVTGGTLDYTYVWSVDNADWTIVDKNANPVEYSAPSSLSSATFKVKITDANKCTTECTETVTSTPSSLVTDTLRCTLLPTSCSADNSFRLIFLQDPQNFPCYRLVASNPGQFYYNAFFRTNGTIKVGDSVTFNVTLPYPFVTQGANPVEVYDGVTINTSGGQTCLVPGYKILPGTNQVTLASYSPQTLGSTATIQITVKVPPTGYIFLAVHMDYGLKGSTGFSPDSSANALACGGTTILIPNPTN